MEVQNGYGFDKNLFKLLGKKFAAKHNYEKKVYYFSMKLVWEKA